MPATTVVNEVNSDKVSGYIACLSKKTHSNFDYVDEEEEVHKCISTAYARVGKELFGNYSHRKLEMVPDSGATAHMFHSLEFFEIDYKRCKNVFVMMDDGNKVKVRDGKSVC